MATKRYRKPNKSKELTYEDIQNLDFSSMSAEDLEKYGFGSWLKKNAGVVGTIAGGGLGMLIGNPMLGTSIGGSVGGAISSDYMQDEAVKAQNAQTAKMQTAQNNNIALQELQQDMQVNQPLYGKVMCNGGKIKKMAKGGPLKEYYLKTSRGKRKVSKSEWGDVSKYLELQNRINTYYQNKYANQIEELKKLGITTPETYARFIANNPNSALKAEKYQDVYQGSGFTPEEIKYYETNRNLYFDPTELSGTTEGTQDKVTNTLYGGRNFFAGLGLGMEEIPIEPLIPAPKEYGYEPMRGYPNINIGYGLDSVSNNRVPKVFRNAAGQEIPIDPKLGLQPENYPEFTKDFQYVQPKKSLSQTRFEYGGTLNYGGQLHEGPDGGVPVDAMGNPNQVNPVALVEKGEVSYNTPDGGTYIYSDTLKHDKNKTFAKKAKDIQRRYKFRMKDGVINDPFAKKTYDAEMLQLQDNQEDLKNFQNMQKESSEIKKNGGNLPLYFGPNSTNNWSMKLPPLVKPIDNTAAMDEFVNQVEMDYPSRLVPKTANIPTTGISAQLPQMKQDVGNLANNSNPQLYQGMNWAQTGLAAAGPVLGGITGLILNSRRKAPVNLKLSRMTPQQINLERRRAAARESAGVATSNLSRALKGVSPTAGSYMSNVVAGITDIDRNLSNALGESYTQEELQNAQLRQQAEAANLDIDMQEQMYNSQLQNQFDASKEAARNAYINQITGGITGGLSQKFQSEQNANYLNMLNPDYAYYGTGKGLSYKPYIAPRRR